MDFTKDIYINKDTIYEDSEIVVLYKGSLFSKDCLSKDVYISYGYGNLWDNKSEIKMKASTFGYLVTVNVESGENLQFCFRDNNGIWDNNNYQNYILPIKENETVLSFKSLADTEKEISFEISDNPDYEQEPETVQDIFESSVISSNPVELYQTVDLENITKQAIPDDTVVTQISLDENSENVVSKAVIKSPEPDKTLSEAFSELTEKAKEQSVKAFDENKVTAGSVYVNSIVKDIQETPKVVENIVTEETSLMPQSETTFDKAIAFLHSVTKNLKSAFSKVVKLVKTSLNFKEDND